MDAVRSSGLIALVTLIAVACEVAIHAVATDAATPT